MICSSLFIAGRLARARPFANRKRVAARALLATRRARCNYDFARIKEMSSRGRRAADADGETGRKGNAQGGSSSLMLDANSGGETIFSLTSLGGAADPPRRCETCTRNRDEMLGKFAKSF